MRLLGYLLLASVAFAALKVAVAVMLVVLAIGFCIALIRRPGEVLGFALLVVAANHPWPFVAALSSLVVIRIAIGERSH